MTIHLAEPFETFLVEVRREFGPEAAQGFREAFTATEIAADDCPEHQKFLTAIGWICSARRPLRERLDEIDRVVNQPRGYVTVSMPRSEVS
jgi:hypothetical protein